VSNPLFPIIRVMARRYRWLSRSNPESIQCVSIRVSLQQCLTEYCPGDKVKSLTDIECVDEGWDHLVVEMESGFSILIPV